MSATSFVRLRSRLYDVIDLQADQVLFVPLCTRCVTQIEALGRPMEPVDAKDVVVVV
jgi:CRISPR-associated protein Cas2